MALQSIRRAIAAFDAESGGPAAIAGVLRELTTPVAGRTLFLVRQDDMRVCRRTVSGTGGVYVFANVAAGTQWVVMAFDPNGAYNVVGADRVQT